MKQRGNHIIAMNADNAHIKTLIGVCNEPTKETEPFFELQGSVTQTKGISKRGGITNKRNLTNAVGRALETAAAAAGYEINEIILSYTHPDTQFFKKTVGLQNIKDKEGIYITEKWLEQQEERIKDKIYHTHKHKRIAHFEITSLLIDGEEVIYDPHEFTATESIYITFTYLLVPIAFLGTLLESIEQFTTVYSLQPDLIANGALLSDVQKEQGVIICDIGPDLTNITVYKNGTMENARVFPFGDNTITTEIALLKKIPPEEAVREKESIASEESALKKRDLQSIDKKIAALIKKQVEPYLKEIDTTKRFPNGIMLVGEGSLYPNIEKVVEKALGLHTFHAKPTYHVQTQQTTEQIEWYTAYATLHSTVMQYGIAALYGKKTSLWKKITGYLHTITRILR